MNKEQKQLNSFIKQAEDIAREWVEAEVDGRNTHPEYTNKISMIAHLAKEVMNANGDEPKDA